MDRPAFPQQTHQGARRTWPRLPRHGEGLRIGLLGGSFNPPHEAHRLISQIALRRLQLDRVWWLVTPGNPLKDNRGLPPLETRIAAARAMAADPRIDVTGFEADIGVHYTRDTVEWLVRRCPGVHFVWLMGSDNLASFHRWHRWKSISGLVPLAVIDRPGSTLRSVQSPAAQWLAPRRLPEYDAPRLPFAPAPAWVFLHGPRSSLSSTALRNTGRGLAPDLPRSRG